MTDIQSVTDDVPCGCGPTAEEARTLRGGITRRRALSAGAIGVFLAATGASLAPSAFAAEYPTWDDVEKARNNEAAKGAEVTRIQGLIRSLVIAYIGSTGASSGCHLHFEVYVGGVRVNPAPFLRARGVAV